MLRTKVYRSWMGFVESGNRPRDLGVVPPPFLPELC